MPDQIYIRREFTVVKGWRSVESNKNIKTLSIDTYILYGWALSEN